MLCASCGSDVAGDGPIVGFVPLDAVYDKTDASHQPWASQYTGDVPGVVMADKVFSCANATEALSATGVTLLTLCFASLQSSSGTQLTYRGGSYDCSQVDAKPDGSGAYNLGAWSVINDQNSVACRIGHHYGERYE